MELRVCLTCENNYDIGKPDNCSRGKEKKNKQILNKVRSQALDSADTVGCTKLLMEGFPSAAANFPSRCSPLRKLDERRRGLCLIRKLFRSSRLIRDGIKQGLIVPSTNRTMILLGVLSGRSERKHRGLAAPGRPSPCSHCAFLTSNLDDSVDPYFAI